MKKVISIILCVIISIGFLISDNRMIAYADSIKWNEQQYGTKYGNSDVDFSIDTIQKSGNGKYSIKIKNNKYTDKYIPRVEKTFEVKPNTMYKATVIAKCADYKKSKNYKYDKYGAVLATKGKLPSGTSYTGSTWKKLSYCFNSGDSNKYTLALYNAGGKGAVYFSDFQLEELSDDSNKWNICVVYIKNIKAPITQNGKKTTLSATFCQKDMDYCTKTINKMYSYMNLLSEGKMDIKSIDFYECNETVKTLYQSPGGQYSMSANDKTVNKALDKIITDSQKNSGKRYDHIILVSPIQRDLTGKYGHGDALYKDIHLCYMYVNHLEFSDTFLASLVHETLHTIEGLSEGMDPEGTPDLHANYKDSGYKYSEQYYYGQNGLPGAGTWFSDYMRKATYDGKGADERAFYAQGKIVYADGKAVDSTKKVSYKTTDVGTLKISEISDKTFTGKAIKPAVTVKDGKTKLKKDTDYTLSYSCNTDIGIASVIITGKGKYSGTIKQNFNIIPSKTELTVISSGSSYNLSWKASKGATGYKIYGSTDSKKFKLLKTVDADDKKTSLSTKITSNGKKYTFKIKAYTEVYPQTFYSKY